MEKERTTESKNNLLHIELLKKKYITSLNDKSCRQIYVYITQNGFLFF